MSALPPGAWRRPDDRWGSFDALAGQLPEGALALVDRKVARLHPALLRALEGRRPARTELLTAGERVKRMEVAMGLLARAAALPRGATVLAVGGGTVGDLAAVVAHLHKRGAPLIHVPTTLLAAVDSSLGGKGAVDVSTRAGVVKNAAGVFHNARATWLCPELFTTLEERQLREGAIEAWKMAVCLRRPLWRSYLRRPPELPRLITDARRLKAAVCAQDPYETSGLRRVLNFGHTFGHALESASAFRLSHGDAVGIGMLCALDVGRAVGVTPPAVAEECEAGLCSPPGPVRLGRKALAAQLRALSPARLEPLLAADKKAQRAGAATMVLLRGVGDAVVRQVPHEVWRGLWGHWRSGRRP